MRTIALSSECLSEQLQTACILECAARKPGNVHPQAAFADVDFASFLRSAQVSAPVLAQAAQQGVGKAVLQAVQATRTAVGSNTNLGMLLLLAPLAAVPAGMSLPRGIPQVLASLTQQDAVLVYEAIRQARPGGLGTVSEADVAEPPQITLREAMQLAADRDQIARQYAHGFADILGFGLQRFLMQIDIQENWEQAIIALALDLLAHCGDTLILRKCGEQMAGAAQAQARRITQLGTRHSDRKAALRDFDAWLRADGHRRNPGSTADFVAAILFASLRDGQWTCPTEISIPDPV